MRRKLKIIRGARFWKSLLSRGTEGWNLQSFQDGARSLSGWDAVCCSLSREPRAETVPRAGTVRETSPIKRSGTALPAAFSLG